MGEIGIDRREFLYDLRLWEIISIRRGYGQRLEKNWQTARFMAYCTVKSSMNDTKDIRTPQDLLKLPTDGDNDEPKDLPTDAEIERLKAEMKAYNDKQENDGNTRKRPDSNA